MIGFFSECVDAVGTTTEVDFLPGNLFLDGQMSWFLCQAAGAYYKIADFLQIFLRIRHEYIHAPLATEVVIFALVATGRSLVFADLQPYQ